jgi:hypothetical protein
MGIPMRRVFMIALPLIVVALTLAEGRKVVIDRDWKKVVQRIL